MPLAVISTGNGSEHVIAWNSTRMALIDEPEVAAAAYQIRAPMSVS
jgi:hypothetical protein